MFLIDTSQGRIIDDEEIKSQLAAEHPYGDWLDEGLKHLDDLPEVFHITESSRDVLREQQTFGYTHEEIKILIEPMARAGIEALGSMGTDTPIAVLSDRPRLLYDYFTQLFAQVTNPPLDAIREELVTSVGRMIGPEGNVLEPTAESCHLLELPHPILDNVSLDKILHIEEADPRFKAHTVRTLFPAFSGGDGLRRALERIRKEVSEAIADGVNIIVLSDWHSNEDLAPIPMLLATAAVHHHLIREKSRTKVGLIVETGEAREVHHFCLLMGYGAAAINPYLAFDTIEQMVREGGTTLTDFDQATKNYAKAAGKGVLKVMSKMGISTVASYTGAQIFEAIGLGEELVDEYFTGTVSRLGGIGLDEVAEEARRRHATAYPLRPEERAHRALEYGGEYQWRREGEYHLFNPKTVFKLQHATRSGQYEVFKEYTQLVDDQSEQLATLRGLFRLSSDRPPVPIDEVEPASEIVRRFSTGAMSYGSISAESHETLAIAMNRLGGKSNTGEGGEDVARFTPMENGDSKRSAIKQVASGRFGVTSEYLTNADDIQIKMAQGAKPGEGGQLPGHKVYPWIAGTRHSTPGVGLISPPPHHDIYSIEDLAQLIHDLKNSNPSARVHVKLVAEVGVGTVAAGVAKAKSDVVLISGHDGGTGASPLTSLKHAGAPWELGLAETQQTLVLNGLRDRIVVQADGQMKTGRDVVIAALLGAEEFGFATAPLVVSGCIMMRVCHLDTCPVGIATQNPELRARYSRQAGVRRELHAVHRPGGARAARRARLPLDRGGDRPCGVHRRRGGGRPLEGLRSGPEPDPARGRTPRGRPPVMASSAGPRTRRRARPDAHRRVPQRHRHRPAGAPAHPDPQRQPDRGHDARSRAHQGPRRRGPARGLDRDRLRGIGRQQLRRLRALRGHAATARRRERLRRQGPVGRAHHRPSARGVPRRTSSPSRTSSPAT